jgi:hypothetical protein
MLAERDSLENIMTGDLHVQLAQTDPLYRPGFRRGVHVAENHIPDTAFIELCIGAVQGPGNARRKTCGGGQAGKFCPPVRVLVYDKHLAAIGHS